MSERALHTFDRQRAAATVTRVVADLFPTRRSLTGDGNRAALAYLGGIVSSLETVEVPSGTRLFDWTAPPEWRLRDARLVGPDGSVIVDLKTTPLAVVGYSEGVDVTLDLEELRPHLHSIPERPEAVPYRTSYYDRTWGFCLPHSRLTRLQPGRYRAVVDAEHDWNGSLSYGDALVGRGLKETILTAHICHPAQANDNLSGMAVLASVLEQLEPQALNHAVRGLFLPGGIGSLAWLATNEGRLSNVSCGMSLACLGGTECLTFKATRSGDSLIDRAVELAARDAGITLREEPFDPYGFDERNFSSPGIGVPFGSLMRSRHGEYPEYHSSDDSIDLIEPEQLVEAAEFVFRVVTILDSNRRFKRYEPRGEPQLGRRGLYSAIGGHQSRPRAETALLWVANLSDGNHDLIDMALRSRIDYSAVLEAAEALLDAGVVYDAGHADVQSTSG